MSVIYRKFEARDQKEVAEFYKQAADVTKGITIYYECYSWFVADMLGSSGDMWDIQTYFLSGVEGQRRCFWVAELDGSIVGCVGAIQSTIYGDDYAELVR